MMLPVYAKANKQVNRTAPKRPDWLFSPFVLSDAHLWRFLTRYFDCATMISDSFPMISGEIKRGIWFINFNQHFQQHPKPQSIHILSTLQ
jgi:hypothetical protein